MNSCKYWDCGWCYAPDDVETNARIVSKVCYDPNNCPYLKSQMTKEIDISRVLMDGDIVTIMGVKYQRIIEPQSFYDKLSELLDTEIGDDTPCGMITDMVSDLIRENIPEPYENLKFGVSEWFLGYNEALRRVNERLFDGIQ